MVEPVLEATIEETVTEAMLADAVGSGDVPVLATPAVLALVERAAVRALDGSLEPGETSVGSWVELSHLAPTPLDASVTASVRLEEVDGRRLTFAFSVRDPAGECAAGRHGRVVVQRDPFLEAAASRGR
jgi:fluoroacetyl-CoA thioesterase